MLSFFRRRRRARLEQQPFPPGWLEILQKRFPYHRLLSAEEQRRLQLLIRSFLDAVNFEGCAGLQITDEIRVTIAAQASVLLLKRDEDAYPGLRSVLVYPTAYSVPSQHVDEIGVVHEGSATHAGEAWQRGAVILSWDDVRRDTAEMSDGQNVPLHEFAHQLDQQDGTFDGAPLLETHAHYRSWARILMKEFEALQRAAERGEASLLDQYGASDPAEFFAVTTEAFFEKPKALQATHPELYAELQNFYRQDPAERSKG